MTKLSDNNIFGFYASFNSGDTDQELVKTYLWGANGLKDLFKSLKWQTYGEDFHLILFEFYVKPIPSLRDALKEIGSYRRKEKSIGIPIILHQDNFFELDEINRFKFFQSTIIKRLELLREKVKRNKLDLDIEKLRTDTEKYFGQASKNAST
jgi:hypothetical protein